MKKIISVLLISCVLALGLVGCGSDKEIDGKMYSTYGLLNAGEDHDPCIHYSPIIGNIIWGCLLAETIIAPVYFFGFSCMEPTWKKPDCVENKNLRANVEKE